MSFFLSPPPLRSKIVIDLRKFTVWLLTFGHLHPKPNWYLLQFYHKTDFNLVYVLITLKSVPRVWCWMDSILESLVIIQPQTKKKKKKISLKIPSKCHSNEAELSRGIKIRQSSQRAHNIETTYNSTLIQRLDFGSTLNRRCFDVMCLLGLFFENRMLF